MNRFFKLIFFFLLIGSASLLSCKEKTKMPVKKQTTTKLADKKENSKPKPVLKKELKPVVEKVPNKYFLIVASFENKNNAEKMKKKLTEEGYVSEIHLAKNGFYRVSYQGFSDRKLAFKELRNVRSTEEHHDTWLYIKR